MNIPAFDQVVPNEHPILGSGPVLFFGTTAPDGDAEPWKTVPVGSEYRRQAEGHLQVWRKINANGRDDDWTCVQGVISQRVAYTEFTDGGSTAGTLELDNDIPAGAWVQQTILRNVTGFAGDTSATIKVGDGSDVDRYSTGTPSVFATAAAIDVGVPSGTKIHTEAKTPTLTITSGADWGSVNAGALTIFIYYLM